MKKLMISALLIAGAMSSCSKDEVTDVVAMSDTEVANTIGLDISSSVTRAMATDANAIRSNDLAVYYYTGFDGTDKVTNASGYITFTYANGEWGQTGNSNSTDNNPTLLWKNVGLGTDGTDVASVSFYSISTGATNTPGTTYDTASTYDSNAYGTLSTTSVTAENAVFESFTQSTVIAEQYDVVSYGGTVEAVPAGGTISATFNHALSQVELYADLGGADGTYAAYVKSVAIVNLNTTGVATVTNAGATTWDTTNSQTAIYPYLNRVDASTSSETTGLFIHSSSKSMLSEVSSDGTSTYVDIIIIPQDVVNESTTAATQIEGTLISALSAIESTITAIDPSDKSNDTTEQGTLLTYLKSYDAAIGTSITQPYVASMYRMIDKGSDSKFHDANTTENADDDGDVVGYKSASESGQYQTMANLSYDNCMKPYAVDYSNDNQLRAVGATDHLYAMVAFTFDSAFVFTPQYTYDLVLSYATSGGILISQFYYDSYGKITNIPVEGINVGESVLPDGDAEIGIKVATSDWLTPTSSSTAL